ncbi:ATP-binding protein [Streptomyces alboflavus]|uniref:ATP-binding protein n=1 Tax=Streptomyces alboflavus TaxID=67267 RepID=UPI0036A8497C
MSEVTRRFRRRASAIPAARTFVQSTLAAWEINDPSRADDVLLCVSELATNALLYGTTGSEYFLVKLSETDARLRVEVHDTSRRRPRAKQPSAEAVNGRGLLLVNLLADGYGVEPRPSGKVVWSEFKVAARTLPSDGAGDVC